MLESPVIEQIRQNQEDAEDDRRGVKGWFSVIVPNEPCKGCGAPIEYVSINHIPACWKSDDEMMHQFVQFFQKKVGKGEVVEAPENAIPWNTLKEFEKKCDRKGRKA